MKIFNKAVGLFGANCYILRGGVGGEAVVVDPGGDAEVVLELLAEGGMGVAAYLLTHGHADHLGGLSGMVGVRPAPVYVHPADASWCFGEGNCIAGFYDAPPLLPEGVEIRATPKEGEDLVLGGLRFRVLETPGHTPGGVCWMLPDEKTVLTGDTLFAGSVGRTDLPGGDLPRLMASLKRVMALPDDWLVLPGHEGPSEIGKERRTNPWLL